MSRPLLLAALSLAACVLVCAAAVPVQSSFSSFSFSSSSSRGDARPSAPAHGHGRGLRPTVGADPRRGQPPNKSTWRAGQHDEDPPEPLASNCTLACSSPIGAADGAGQSGGAAGDVYQSRTALPATVSVGVYLTEITALNQDENTFYATGYFWLVWDTCQVVDGFFLRPDLSLVIENTSQDWAATLTAEQDGPLCDTPKPGRSYRSYRFNLAMAMFFSYVRYPLDTQDLFLAFEDLELDEKKMVFKIDSDSDFQDDTIVIPGFFVKQKLEKLLHSAQETTYGLGGSRLTYSRAEIGIVIQRRTTYFVLKVLPPILFVLGTAVLTICLDPLRVLDRLSLATTALLTEVFLQLGLADSLPEIGVVTVNDWVFNFIYVILLLIVLECMVVAFIVNRVEVRAMKVSMDETVGQPEQGGVAMMEQRRKLARLIDFIFGIVVAVLSTVGLLIVILLAVYA